MLRKTRLLPTLLEWMTTGKPTTTASWLGCRILSHPSLRDGWGTPSDLRRNTGVPLDFAQGRLLHSPFDFAQSPVEMTWVRAGKWLFADDQDGECVGDHLASGWALAGLSWGWGCELGGDEEDVVGFGVEGEGFRAGLGREGLLDGEAGGGVLLDDGEVAFAVGTEGFHGGGVEGGAVGASADGESVNDFAVGGVEDHHVLRVAAGGEEDVVLDVDGEAGAAVAFAGEAKGGGELEGFGVDDGDAALVFEVDVDVALVVGDGLFGRSAEIDGADDGAVPGVDDGDVRRAVAQDVDAAVGFHDAVGAALHVDGLDGGERFYVPHDDGLAGAEAVAGLLVDGDAVGAGVGDFTDRLEGVEIEDRDVAGGSHAGDVELPGSGVRVDVVEAALAADFGGAENFVGAGLCVEREARAEEQDGCCRSEREGASHMWLL